MGVMHLVVFEDLQWPALAPFSLSRPAFGLLAGVTSLLAKQIRHLSPTRLTLWVRPGMAELCRQRVAPETGILTAVNQPLDDEPALLLNARTLITQTTAVQRAFGVHVAAGEIVAAHCHARGLTQDDVFSASPAWEALAQLPPMPWPGRLIHSPVDLIVMNDKNLLNDFAGLPPSCPRSAGPYHLVSEVDIWLGGEVSLGAGCVIDASTGPVMIDRGATVGSNAVIQGPCYIGPGAAIAPLAHIRPGVTLGPRCKIGGEVSLSIFLGLANKAHDGFVGHSYIGKWVNLGAGTTTSNLKNTYGEISLHRGKTLVTSGRRFLGSLIGDHAKTAIHTRLMAGTYVGFASMAALSKAVPRHVPSFTFLTDAAAQPYELEKAVEVAQRVYTRRDRSWTDLDDAIIQYVAQTAPLIEA